MNMLFAKTLLFLMKEKVKELEAKEPPFRRGARRNPWMGKKLWEAKELTRKLSEYIED